MSIAKTAEPIEMPFGLRTRVGSRNRVLDGVQIPHGKGHMVQRFSRAHDCYMFNIAVSYTYKREFFSSVLNFNDFSAIS